MQIVKVLGQSNPNASTLTDAYVVPALTQATISTITVCNRSASPNLFRISVAVAGAADAVNQYLYYDVQVPGNDTFTATIGITLQATDVIRVYATTATLSFNIFGVTETTSSTALEFTTNKRILGRMSSGAGAPEELPFVLGTATTTLTGSQSAFDPGTASIIYCNNASLLTIQGILSGFDGQEITFISIGAGQVDFANQHATPSAANRIINGVTGTISLAAGSGRARLIYDTSTARWRVVDHEQGMWITVPYNASDFSGSGSMTWTVENADLLDFKYHLRGRTLTVCFIAFNTTVGGVVSDQLQIKVPGGFTGGNVANGAANVQAGGGTAQLGHVALDPGSTNIRIYRDPGVSWVAGTNNTYAFFTFITSVQ